MTTKTPDAADDGVIETAYDYIRRLGDNAAAYLRELADIDATNGDELSAGTWHEIAAAVERITRKSAA